MGEKLCCYKQGACLNQMRDMQSLSTYTHATKRDVWYGYASPFGVCFISRSSLQAIRSCLGAWL